MQRVTNNRIRKGRGLLSDSPFKAMDESGVFSLHASAVAWKNKAVLMTGASGSGKSSLALELMGFGCTLVADDRVDLTRREELLLVSAPQTIQNMIEARGIGLLNARAVKNCPLHLVVDMNVVETDRLPPQRLVNYLGIELPLLHKLDSPHFPAAILQYLKAGRRY